jgi:hypothetical protein
VFAFRLALALGRTVDELLEALTYHEFARWMEFDSFQPIGERREDIRTAMMLAQTANMNRDPKKRASPYELADFMPFETRLRDVQKLNRPATERATLSMDTLAFLTAKAVESGHTVNLKD